MRRARFAGSFYPSAPEECERDGRRCLAHPATGAGWVAGIVPHAGWMYSGSVAGKVIATLAQTPARTVVLIGNDHRGATDGPTVFDRGEWESPLGPVHIDEPLAARIVAAHHAFRSGTREHDDEHSIEVQVPLVQLAFGANVMIVPILVPSTIDREAGAALAGCLDDDCVVIGTTDLTHYGPNYAFEPAGSGETGLAWMRSENDPRLIDLLVGMKEDEVEAEAHGRRNACGPGAVALTMAAARARGARHGQLLTYATSHDVRPSSSFVGYAGVVF